MFLWLEMFAWTTKGPKVFKTLPKDLFIPTKAMAANQGLYNGFLVAGLCWSVFTTDAVWSFNLAVFFLGCVMVASVFGAVTVSKRIFYIQGLPALLALLFWIIA